MPSSKGGAPKTRRAFTNVIDTSIEVGRHLYRFCIKLA